MLETYEQVNKTFTMFAQRNWNVLMDWGEMCIRDRMMIPNLLAVLALSGTVVQITKNYLDRKVNGKDIPPRWSAFAEYQKAEEAEAAEEAKQAREAEALAELEILGGHAVNE